MEMQRKERIGVGQVMRAAAVLGAALFLVWCDPIVSHAEAVGKVIPKSVNIRKQPDQDSEVIGSATGGKEITIRGKVEKDGVTTWYQVYVSGETVGYVRADMVEKTGDGDIPTVTASETAGESAAAADETAEPDAPEGGETGAAASGGAQVQAQEEMARQYGTVNVKAKVRPDPSTSNTPVDSIASGTQVVVSGKSEGSDGKTWYYVTFTGSNGSEKTGFIRSDLMDLGDMLPVEEEPEEEPQEEPEEPEPAPNNDYELKIETDSEGEEVWYIYDNVKGKKQKLVPLLESAYAQMLGDTQDTDAIVKQRIVIVALAVLLAVLVITVIVMAFKLRDAYYEDDEDDDDEEEDEEESDRRPVRREREREREERQPRRNTPDEEERKARRREEAKPAAGAKADRPERKRREPDYEEKQDAKETARPAKRKAKNFLLDDDEFEFEFLNMDDKDLK